jgi:hypothetical protein
MRQQSVRNRRGEVERTAGLLPDIEIVVPAAEQRRAKRGDERKLVARVAERTGASEEVADLGSLVDERAGLGAIRDVRAIQGVLEEGQRRTSRNEYGDVAGFRGTPAVRALVVHQPAVGQRLLDDRGDVARLALAEDGRLSAGKVVVRRRAEDGDGGTRQILVVLGKCRRLVGSAAERQHRGEV